MIATVVTCLGAGQALTIIGLLLDIVGVIVLFWFAPEKHPHPQWSLAFQLNQADQNEWEAKDRRRRRIALASVVAIIVGFLLQLAGELMRVK